MIKVCLYVLFPSSTCLDIHSDPDGMVGKLSVSAFQNFIRSENPLSIKDVPCQNVCVWTFPIFDIFDIHSLTRRLCTLSVFDIFAIALIFCTVFNAFNAMYLNTSNMQTMCIDTYWHAPCNVHTTDKVTMGVNEWLPHYLIRSRSHCNSNFNSK